MSIWSKIDRALDQTRKHVLNYAAILAVLLVSVLVVEDVIFYKSEVEAIDVAPALAGQISGEALATELRDGIELDWHNAAQSSPINVIQSSASEPDITISGTNLQIRYIAKLLRSLFGRPAAELSGRMVPDLSVQPPDLSQRSPGSPTVEGPRVRLTLRNSIATVNPYFDEAGPLDQVMAHAARASLAQIDPYAAVVAYSQGSLAEKQQALRLAIVTLAAEPGRARSGRGYLANATAFYQLGRGSNAEEDIKSATDNFIKAIDASGKPEPDYRQRSMAHDGLAIIYTENRDWANAQIQIKEALDDQPGYDSAIYHQVQVADRISEAFFPDEHEGTYCEAEQEFRKARVGYCDFVNDHPGFVVAYTQNATMQLERLHWLRIAGRQPPVCPSIPDPKPRHEACGIPTASSLSDDIASARKAFEDAVFWDGGNPMSWFQSANFLYELQDGQYRQAETDPVQRVQLLREAVDDYKAAVRLNDWDYYIWYRYAETLRNLANLDDGSRESDTSDAVFAYCKSIETNGREPGLVESAKQNLVKLRRDCPPLAGAK
jgi:tetratricopeptide (TPR) repeat protein